MFDSFGEFDSYEEINRAAEAQKKEGDREALYALAKENGLSVQDADYYLEGTDALAYPLTAAIGKLEIEKTDLKLKGILSDMVAELIDFCTDDIEMCLAVRKQGKNLADFMALLIEEGYRDREIVDQRIVEKTKEVKEIVGHHELSIGVPTRLKRRELAEAYYKEGKK